MSREIKFRAWNIATKTMIDLKKITPLALNMDTDGLFIPFSDGLILMQYTGLKDKNGREIYEGDILEGHSDGLVKVEWANENGGWECIFSDEANIGIAEMCTWFGNNATVVGNIYENPELLQTKHPSHGDK